VGVEDMNLSCTHEVLTNWRRPDMEGDSGDASVIEKTLAESIAEPNDSDLSDEQDQDDTYIGDGHVAPVDSVGERSRRIFCLNDVILSMFLNEVKMFNPLHMPLTTLFVYMMLLLPT
jgi:hypothetical protein